MDKKENLKNVIRALSSSEQGKEAIAHLESLNEDDIAALPEVKIPEPLFREGVMYNMTIDTIERHNREVQNYIKDIVDAINKCRSKGQTVGNKCDNVDD